MHLYIVSSAVRCKGFTRSGNRGTGGLREAERERGGGVHLYIVSSAVKCKGFTRTGNRGTGGSAPEAPHSLQRTSNPP